MSPQNKKRSTYYFPLVNQTVDSFAHGLIFILVIALIWMALIALLGRYETKEVQSPVEQRIEQIKPTSSLPPVCELSMVWCHNEVLARVTEYGPTGNRMASGKWPYVGAVAVSDRSIPLGTKVSIEGQEYVVEDRTAEWVHTKFPIPTVDIFSLTPHGKRELAVKIL